MASNETLKKLFDASKASPLFEGLSDKQIADACNKYADKTDDYVEIMINNIQTKNEEKAEEAKAKEEAIQKSHELAEQRKVEEGKERQQDEQSAEELLASLENL